MLIKKNYTSCLLIWKNKFQRFYIDFVIFNVYWKVSVLSRCYKKSIKENKNWILRTKDCVFLSSEQFWILIKTEINLRNKKILLQCFKIERHHQPWYFQLIKFSFMFILYICNLTKIWSFIPIDKCQSKELVKSSEIFSSMSSLYSFTEQNGTLLKKRYAINLFLLWKSIGSVAENGISSNSSWDSLYSLHTYDLSKIINLLLLPLQLWVK